MKTKWTIVYSVVVFLSGHATTGQCAQQGKYISYEEASAFERSLLALSPASSEVQKPLYVQPINKKEPCKLPTTQDQLVRKNFRAYWDGECKSGFAFGLGRDIAISDTHHVEEITVHTGSEDSWSGPHVSFDYVNNRVSYLVGGSKYPASTEISEKYEDSVQGFNAYHSIRVIDDSGKLFEIQSSAFHPQRIYFYSRLDKSIGYRFTDFTALPAVSPSSVSAIAEIVDLRTNTPGGIKIELYANGSVQHLQLVGGRAEPVVIPSKYIDHINARYREIMSATAQANSILQSAQQIEREYLYKVCGRNGSMKGIDTATYTKVCTWRDQFKGPYATASANYQAKLEVYRQRVANAEQQRQIQEQIALQQQLLQQQKKQHEWNVASQEYQQLQQGFQQLQQSSQQLLQSSQQTLQSVSNWQAPQVQPITPFGGSKVICQTIGRITMCR
jgi:hypothetical protein